MLLSILLLKFTTFGIHSEVWLTKL